MIRARVGDGRRARETLTPPDEVTKVDAFAPDYEDCCDACGASPTVLGVKDGKVIYASGLCAVCTWGEGNTEAANWEV